MRITRLITVLIIIGTFFITGTSLQAVSPEDPIVPIGNISRIQGVRDNQLLGYGIVIGLAGTGDSNRSQATIQSVANMLKTQGLEITPGQIQSRNLAAVIVTADLPPFTHSGDRIDVTVSSMGDARSLQGGTLLMAPLKAANGQVYAVAQGPISIGGFNARNGGNSVRQNHPTVGRVPEGALVEREVEVRFDRDEIYLLLDQPNYQTASYISQAINNTFTYLEQGPQLAKPVDAGKIAIKIPELYRDNVIPFVAQINNLEVRTSTEARVVINEKTGTIVMGHDVKISTVSIAHGNLTVTVSSKEEVSQPPAFSQGETAVTTQTDIKVEEEAGHLMVIPGQGTIRDLVTALNAIGASPRDIIAILQEIKAAGALHARLEMR